jgi:hypothetical protein
MADSSKDSSSTVTGVVAILLLAVGVFVQQLPLERIRPVSKTKPIEVPLGLQTVSARLWQDPIDAARQEWEKLNADKANGPGLLKSKAERFKTSFASQWNAACGEHVDCTKNLTVLGVVVFGGGYTESAESRRRSRYAVLSALSVSDMRPHDSEHIDYVMMDDAAKGAGASWFVPYELFMHRTSGQSYTSDTANAGRFVLVLWLDDHASPRPPVRTLKEVAAKLGLDDKKYAARMKLVVASGTDALQSVLKESRADRPKGVDVLSPNSTVEDNVLQEPLSRDAFGQSRRIFRTIGTDDLLADAIVKELSLRNVRPGCDSGTVPWATKKAHLLLISEWDTTYSRALPETFCRTLRKSDCGPKSEPEPNVSACADLAWVRRLTYMRGLDGEVLGDVDAEGGAKGAGSPGKKSDQGGDSAKAAAGSRQSHLERAEGNSQFDYVRRINDRISRINAQIKEKENGEIMAIGVLGSDYYDKLLVLQGLRKAHPRAVFFTTDVDARLFQDDQYIWTRNLLVGSHYGLELNEQIHGDMPPFRDNYQTATFLATRLAVEPACQMGFSTDSLKPFFAQPRLFEIGRNGLVDISPGVPEPGKDAPVPSLCTRDSIKFASGWTVHPEPLIHSRFIVAVRVLGIAAGMALLALFLSSRLYGLVAATTTLHRSVAIGVAASIAILVGFFAWLVGKSPDEEPFLLFQGVSVWGTEIIRLVALVLSLGFIWKSAREIRESNDQLRDDFFPHLQDAQSKTTLRELLSPWNYSLFKSKGAKAGSLTVSDLWNQYLRLGSIGNIAVHAVVGTVIFMGVGAFVFADDTPASPTRGPISSWVDLVLLLSVVLVYVFLAFFVADAVRVCKAFVRHLASGRSKWSNETVARFTRDMAEASDKPLPEKLSTSNYLRDYIDMRLIAERTEAIGGLIYYPFVILLLIICARSAIFDNWDWTTSLLVMLGVTAALIVLSAYSLRLAAEQARDIALRRLNSELLRAIAREDATAKALLETVIAAVRGVTEGAYRPFTQQPIVRALLIPFGGYGGLAIIEYFLLGKA